jgi:hypothetical protein
VHHLARRGDRLEAGVELQRGRLEYLSRPDAGRVVDEVHRMAAWTPECFAGAMAETPFAYRAVGDGDQEGRPARPVGTVGRLLWRELVLER